MESGIPIGMELPKQGGCMKSHHGQVGILFLIFQFCISKLTLSERN